MAEVIVNIVKTECSECQQPVTINIASGMLTATLPSNGKRGAGHVPAHEVTEDVGFDAGGDLALWDCPACGYADSTYTDPGVRADLS